MIHAIQKHFIALTPHSKFLPPMTKSHTHELSMEQHATMSDGNPSSAKQKRVMKSSAIQLLTAPMRKEYLLDCCYNSSGGKMIFK